MSAWQYGDEIKFWMVIFWSTILIFLCILSLILQISMARKARGWVAVEAKVEEINDAWWTKEGLTKQPRFKSIKIQYSYYFGGNHFIGTGVTLNDILNIMNYDKDLHVALQFAKDNGKPISVWVNPDDPSESLINRNIVLTDIIASAIIIMLITLGWLVWFVARSLG